MADIEEIRAAVAERNAVIGTEVTMKLLRGNKVKKIFMAANVKESTDKDISHYAKINGVPIVKLNINNKDLGTICKKSFAISVIGIRKA